VSDDLTAFDHVCEVPKHILDSIHVWGLSHFNNGPFSLERVFHDSRVNGVFILNPELDNEGEVVVAKWFSPVVFSSGVNLPQSRLHLEVTGSGLIRTISSDQLNIISPRILSVDNENFILYSSFYPHQETLEETLIREGIKGISSRLKTIAELLCKVHQQPLDIIPNQFQPTAKKMNDIMTSFRTKEAIGLLSKPDEKKGSSQAKNALTYATTHDHILIGDLVLKNLLLKDDQLCIIDLEALSFGDPAFEIGIFLGEVMSHLIIGMQNDQDNIPSLSEMQEKFNDLRDLWFNHYSYHDVVRKKMRNDTDFPQENEGMPSMLADDDRFFRTVDHFCGIGIIHHLMRKSKKHPVNNKVIQFSLDLMKKY